MNTDGTGRPHEDIARIAEAVTFTGADTALVAGAKVDLRDPSTAAAVLAKALYSRCYVRPGDDIPPRIHDPLRDRTFQDALRSSGGTGEVWEPGWRWEGEEEDQLVAVSYLGVRFWADKTSVRRDDGPGDDCLVRAPALRQKLPPGSCSLVGRTVWHRDAEPTGIVRLYWNCKQSAAVLLPAMLRRALDGAAAPFRFKVARSPDGLSRADAAVLYLPKARYRDAVEPVADVYAALRGELDSATPMFTKRLAPGLGLAEDPGPGTSFGRHRCRIVADALWRWHRAGGVDADEKAAVVTEALLAAGIDPRRPYLSPGSDDAYATGRFSRPRTVEAPETASSATGAWDPDELVAAAERIGKDICASALWHSDGDRCTWFARSSPALAEQTPPFTPVSETLGPDRYSGTSGVALFLAELAVRTGNDDYARTAQGATTHAVRFAAGRDGSANGFGLYSGITGVVSAAARVTRLLGGGTIGHTALVDLLDAALGGRDGDAHDVISGEAGAILGLLELAREPGWGHLEPVIRSLGAALAEFANRSFGDAGPAASGKPPLTGMSHGAAGVAVALFAVAVATGRPEFARAARSAVAYEQRLYDPEEGNWPDLRRADGETVDEVGFMAAWCHGAPGIALARLRAMATDPAHREEYGAQVRAALRTTLATLESRGSVTSGDVTLCHGATGWIDALHVGGRVLGIPSFVDAARSAGAAIAASEVTAMRTGTACGGPNPSLMIGTAGVGHQLLRLADPDGVPSVLCGP